MEENNRKEYYPHMHRGWKLLIGILVILAVFWIGFKAGEFCTIFRAEYGYGYPMMGYGMLGGYGYPPSYYGYATPQGQAVPPSATSTPAPYYYGPGGMMRMMWGYYYPQ